MVRLTDPLGPSNYLQFLDEVDTALQSSQPALAARMHRDAVVIQGQLACSGPDGLFDTFQILTVVWPGFPLIEPEVWETGNRVPRVLDRHVYPNRENCCLCVWEEWLWDVGEPTFDNFLNGPLHSYFVSQSMFEMTGKWPFGDRRHGQDGVLDAYRRILGIGEDADVEKYVQILRQREIKGHNPCPCTSGKKVRDCHVQSLMELKERVPNFLILRMSEECRKYRKV